MNDNTKLKRKDEIMAADLAGDTVMMDIMSGKYYNLGGVGGDIWEILKDEMTVADLVKKLTESYDVSAEQCKKDILPFLEKMTEKGLFIAKN